MVEIHPNSTLRLDVHLNIKNHEAHRLASALAGLTGETLTTAVTIALGDRLERERRRRASHEVAERLMAIGRRYAALPDSGGGSPDTILGYDDNGLPS